MPPIANTPAGTILASTLTQVDITAEAKCAGTPLTFSRAMFETLVLVSPKLLGDWFQTGGHKVGFSASFAATMVTT
jgi:hypothetical protein